MRNASGAGCSAARQVLVPASMLALALAACGPELEDAAPSSVRADVEHLLSGASSGQPPVILITIDTLRADRLSSYGSDRVATPHVDRLATEGIRFANASSTVPFTLPAHSSIMTGLYPPSHGVRENVGYVLAPELVTIAERFRDAGYRTGGFVSAFVLDARWGIARGFDTYVDDFDLDAMAGRQPGVGPAGWSGDDRARAGVARRYGRRGALLPVAPSVRSPRSVRPRRNRFGPSTRAGPTTARSPTRIP